MATARTIRPARAALVDGMGTFDTNIQELSDWVDAHNGQMPSAEAEDPTERRNGQFLANCRRAASGRFNAERRALLDRLVPGWEGVDREAVFACRVSELDDWVDAHNGQMPSAEAEDPTERRNGQFLADCRRAASGRFSTERRALLDRLVPGLVQSGN